MTKKLAAVPPAISKIGTSSSSFNWYARSRGGTWAWAGDAAKSSTSGDNAANISGRVVSMPGAKAQRMPVRKKAS
jgi:hypothetical protein